MSTKSFDSSALATQASTFSRSISPSKENVTLDVSDFSRERTLSPALSPTRDTAYSASHKLTTLQFISNFQSVSVRRKAKSVQTTISERSADDDATTPAKDGNNGRNVGIETKPVGTMHFVFILFCNLICAIILSKQS